MKRAIPVSAAVAIGLGTSVICQAAAEQAGVRVAHLRTGIVLTPDGGALKKLLPLFRLGAGGRFGSGRQWQSWISLDDEGCFMRGIFAKKSQRRSRACRL